VKGRKGEREKGRKGERENRRDQRGKKEMGTLDKKESIIFIYLFIFESMYYEYLNLLGRRFSLELA
jgi:hypothetical protein